MFARIPMACYFQERFHAVKHVAATKGFCYLISFQPKIHDLRFNLEGKIFHQIPNLKFQEIDAQKKNVSLKYHKKNVHGQTREA